MKLAVDKWIEKVHGLAVEKGWWGEVPDLSLVSVLAKLMLVVSELAEVVELVRKPDFDVKEIWVVDKDGVAHDFKWQLEVQVNGLGMLPMKPEGFGIEIADAVIRIFDLAGALRFVGMVHDLEPITAGTLANADNMLAALMRVNMWLGRAGSVACTDPDELLAPGTEIRRLFAAHLFEAAHWLVGISDVVGIDLEQCMEWKHSYNMTRPTRHGGKRA